MPARPQDRSTRGYAQRVARFRKRQEALAGEIKEDAIPRLQASAARHGVTLFVNTLDLRRYRGPGCLREAGETAHEIVGGPPLAAAMGKGFDHKGKGNSVKATPSFHENVVFASGKDGYHTYRIPAVLVSQAGTVLAICEGRRTHTRRSGLRGSIWNG